VEKLQCRMGLFYIAFKDYYFRIYIKNCPPYEIYEFHNFIELNKKDRVKLKFTDCNNEITKKDK
jgi:hypothetical protein